MFIKRSKILYMQYTYDIIFNVFIIFLLLSAYYHLLFKLY